MQRSFFDVTPAELGQLGPEPAVDVLREMIWAEASNLGIPISDTDIPFAVTTSDGGIDAEVLAADIAQGRGLIFAPRTSYQVKAGDFGVHPGRPALIEELLVKPTSIAARKKERVALSGNAYTVDDLSPRVRSCLDGGGTFVVALFGNDNIDTEEAATAKAIVKFLADVDPRYENASIKVWRQSQLCGLIRKFPAIALRIKNSAGLPLLSFDDWSSRLDMLPNFVPAPDQQREIDIIRGALRAGNPIHIRLLGEPGIGKTRLVLEALRTEDLQSLVLYAESGAKIDGSVIHAIQADLTVRIILVVDECSPEQRSMLANTFAASPKLQVISIYQDQDEGDRASNYRLLEMPPLPRDKIEEILRFYTQEPSLAARWADLCDGSPRVAHVVGLNLQTDPQDPLKGDGISMIWTRYLAGQTDRNSPEFRKRHLVMASLSLFKRFGWAPKVQKDAFAIFDMIVSKLDTNLSKAEFIAIVREMNRRKILQGESYLYITPKAFQIKLWIDWWDQYGAGIDMIELVPKLEPHMRQWFVEMIEYGAAAPVSKKLVEHFLSPSGLFTDAGWLNNPEGSSFFFSLSLADPHSALSTLERTIGTLSRDDLLKFDAGRRDVVRALEVLALHPDLFRPAARLLLALAEAETETWSNNASGVFADLFSLGYGETASTGLAPENRLPVLLEAIGDGGLRAQVALAAFDRALNLRSITRFGGDQPFRLGRHVERWKPKTYGEWFSEFRRYWRALREARLASDDNFASKAEAVMLEHVRELLSIEMLQDDVLEALRELADDPRSNKKEVIASLEDVLQYDTDDLPKSAISQVEEMRDRLVGTSYASRLRRFAGMNLLHDELAQETQSETIPGREIAALARESVESPEKLDAELPWLVTREARNGFRFGYTLGSTDAEHSLWPQLLSAWSRAGDAADAYFLGGYLRAIFERDQSLWEAIVQGLARDPNVVAHLPELIWRSGLTDAIGRLLLDLVKERSIAAQSLGIFGAGRATEPLSDEVFSSWLEVLVSTATFDAAVTSINLADMAMLGGRTLSAPVVKLVLLQDVLLEGGAKRLDTMTSHHWIRLAKKLSDDEESNGLLVLEALIKHLGARSGMASSLGLDGERYLDDLVAKYPEEAWQLITPMIEPPMTARGVVITRWLRGDNGFHGRNPGPIRHIPREAIWRWIEVDPKKRASYIASMAPKDFEQSSWSRSLVRDLLIHFGDRAEVRSSVLANLFTGGWTGPASAHYESMKNELSGLIGEETDPNALRWLHEAVNVAETSREQAALEEDARGY